MRDILHLFALVSALGGCAWGCQPESLGAQSLVTADPAEFTIHSVDRIAGQQAGTIADDIVVVSATFSNAQGVQEIVAPNRFVLTDQSTNATYYGLSGGSIDVPAMGSSAVEPGKSVEITVGFRVPVTLATARLTYHP